MTQSILQKAHRNGLRQSTGEFWSGPAMSPDLNPIEHLWRDLKTTVGRRHPSNLRHLEQLAKEEWSKIPVKRCKKLMVTGSDWSQLFYPKGVLPNIKFRVPIILSSPFLEFCVQWYQIWLFFVCFSKANKITKHVTTKTFVIAKFFWEKWYIIWHKCQYFWTMTAGSTSSTQNPPCVSKKCVENVIQVLSQSLN